MGKGLKTFEDHRVLIIAEAGVNHNGEIGNAKKLIDAAVQAGADVVKFQSFTADKLVSRHAKKADYQKQNVEDGEDTQYRMLKGLELTPEIHEELLRYCQQHEIQFLSTAFDVEGIGYLDQLGLPFFKSPSGELTNYPYLRRLAKTGKPVFLSTGMADMDEIGKALEVLLQFGLSLDQITVLHCTTEYPAPLEEVNLKAMNTISEALGVQVGYSDHTLGTEVPIAAVALGARVIEKHFTLDRALPGPDHRASLEPEELREMVSAIRNIEKAVSGDGRKVPSESERKNKEIARKSLHVARDLPEGKIIEEADLLPLRPGDGISPMEWNRVVGRKTTKVLSRHVQLTWEDFR